MTDFLTPEERSVRMSAIKGRKNKTTELALAALFRRHGINGWRRHYPIPGRPDFVFTTLRLAIFVDGCFWHACPVHYKLPSSNTTFWANKARANRSRDRRTNTKLKAKGWHVLRIWEHSLLKPQTLLARINRKFEALNFTGSSEAEKCEGGLGDASLENKGKAGTRTRPGLLGKEPKPRPSNEQKLRPHRTQ